jgi:hypothetical protein
MKKFVLSALATVAVAAALPTQAAQAGTQPCKWDASGATCQATFTGTAHINCFGCGPSTGYADLTVTTPAGSGTVHATFSVNEPANSCPQTGSASGSFSGYISGTFTWTRTGGTAVIRTSGDINGMGAAGFAVPGNPCGGPVDATVGGAIIGN